MATYEDFLLAIGITRINKDTKSLDYINLTGPEKLKVFQNIKIASLLQGLDHAEDIQEIWKAFSDLV